MGLSRDEARMAKTCPLMLVGTAKTSPDPVSRCCDKNAQSDEPIRD